MKFSRTISLAFFAAPAALAFTTAPSTVTVNRGTALADTPFFSTDIASALDKEVSYSPGKADTDFARKYGHLAGVEVKTVGEAFTSFTDILGTPVNALYKGICTDLVDLSTSSWSTPDSNATPCSAWVSSRSWTSF
jgi:hypothetical protein